MGKENNSKTVEFSDGATGVDAETQRNDVFIRQRSWHLKVRIRANMNQVRELLVDTVGVLNMD